MIPRPLPRATLLLLRGDVCEQVSQPALDLFQLVRGELARNADRPGAIAEVGEHADRRDYPSASRGSMLD